MPPKGKEQGAQANKPVTGTRASARQAQPAAKTAAAAANKKANDEAAAAAPAAASASAQPTGTEPATVAKDEYDKILASNDPEALDAYFIEKFPKNEPDRVGKALDAYLAKEFPDDAQTDLKNRVLATYLKKTLFRNAKKPSEMKAEIDKVDAKVKAYYLLTLFRADVQGTLLNKPDLKFAELDVSDFERSDPKEAKIQKVVTDLNFSAPGWPYLPGTNFVLNDDILKTVYSNVVASRVQSLFQNNKRGLPTKNVLSTLIGRLGSYYGLQRYPVDQQEPKGCIPTSDDESGRCDEHVVEKNLFRFALFGPQNEQNLVFEVSETNTNALLYAFNDEPYVSGKKKAFGRDDFPDKLKLAAYPFFVQAAQKLTDAGKNIGAGLESYLNKFAPEMSDAQKAKLAAAADVNQPEEKRQMDTGPTPFQSMPAQPAAKDAAAAAAEAQKAAENISADEQGRSTDADVMPKEANCQALIDQLAQYESRVASLETALKTYGETSDNAATLIGEQQTLIKTLSDLKEKTGASVDNIAKLQAQLNECNGAKTALQLKVKELEEKLQDLRARIEVLTQTIGGLQGKLSEIENILQIKVEPEQALATNEDTAEKLRVLKQQLEDRAEAIRARIVKLMEQQAGLEAEKKVCQEKITKGQGELDIIDKTRNQITAELDECKAGRAALLESYRIFCVNQADALTRANAMLAAATKSIDTPLNKLQQAVAKGREEYTGQKAALEKFLSVKEYTKELGDLEASFVQPAAAAAPPPPATATPVEQAVGERK